MKQERYLQRCWMPPKIYSTSEPAPSTVVCTRISRSTSWRDEWEMTGFQYLKMRGTFTYWRYLIFLIICKCSHFHCTYSLLVHKWKYLSRILYKFHSSVTEYFNQSWLYPRFEFNIFQYIFFKEAHSIIISLFIQIWNFSSEQIFYTTFMQYMEIESWFSLCWI